MQRLKLDHLKIINPSSSPSSDEAAPACTMGLCDGLGYIYKTVDGNLITRLCECIRSKDRVKILGERFADIALTDIKPKTPQQSQLKDLLIKAPASSVFIYGAVRTGKTHFLAALFTHWHKKSSQVKYFDDQSLKDELRIAELQNDTSFFSDLVRDYRYIFIDDVGKAVISNFHRSALHRFFNELYKNNRYIFITSNDPLNVLGQSEYWGAPVARRVEDLCQIVAF